DGVYRNSEVWINDHYLGKRPYGYSSFRYDLTPYVKWGTQKNVIAVKVDNSRQPNSRWYSGSGIYRNVWLTTTDKVFVDQWGTFVTAAASGSVSIATRVRNSSGADQQATLITIMYDGAGKEVARTSSPSLLHKNDVTEISQVLTVRRPIVWSLENPYLYKAVSRVESQGRAGDVYETTFGIRSFVFDSERGFILNGKPTKINGVCNHQDLGSLGSAINKRALERQLEILKA